MNLKNCVKCGKLFVAGGSLICPECIAAEEEQFEVVRKYIFDHPGISVVEVAEATEVSEKKILEYLREGRIISENVQGALTCMSCGKAINTGKLCDACASKLSQEVNQLTKPAPEPSKVEGRMHLNRWKR